MTKLTFLRSFCSLCFRTVWLPLRAMMARSEVASLTGITGSGCKKWKKRRNCSLKPTRIHFTMALINVRGDVGLPNPDVRLSPSSWVLLWHSSLTCLVKTMRPSRKGGTRLCTIRCTLAALSSSKSSSTSSRWTTPLVSMRFVSQRSLSCRDTMRATLRLQPESHPEGHKPSPHAILQTEGPWRP